MWLPREERQLLVFYAVYDADLSGNPMSLSVDELQEVTAKRRCAGQIAQCVTRVKKKKNELNQGAAANPQDGQGPSRHMQWLHAKGVIESANKRLQERGLIDLQERGTGHYDVTITLAGWDLGRKYNSWWDGTGLWFREYKDHWIWLIVSFAGGVLGALAVNWLSS
jgi:hypothetical protein